MMRATTNKTRPATVGSRALPLVAAVALGVWTLAPTGCAPQRSGLEIPPQASVVGAGIAIEFLAPEDGIIYLVDNRKTVLSRTIRRGELFVADGAVRIGREQVYTLTDARLYFEPKPLPERGTGLGVAPGVGSGVTMPAGVGPGTGPGPNTPATGPGPATPPGSAPSGGPGAARPRAPSPAPGVDDTPEPTLDELEEALRK